MSPHQQDLAIDLSMALDVAVQGMLNAWRIENPLIRQSMAERAIAYMLVRIAVEQTRDSSGTATGAAASAMLGSMIERVSAQCGQMLLARPIAEAIALCAPAPQPRAEGSHVSDWLRQNVWRKRGGSIPRNVLYERYVVWCGAREQQILPLRFKAFDAIVKGALDLDTIRHSDGMHYLGIVFRDRPADIAQASGDGAAA